MLGLRQPVEHGINYFCVGSGGLLSMEYIISP